MGKLVYGVGISEAGEFKRTAYIDGKKIATKQYDLWYSMIQRCYSEKFQQRCPTYAGCSVSEDFKYFQKFAKWCQKQVGFGLYGYQLDKDILFRGNKQYSETSCVFVPLSINSLLLKRDASRGEFPIGVSWHKRSQQYRAQCADGTGGQIHIGCFTTVEGAFIAYKTHKEAFIKRLALEYRGVLDYRVFDALMNYEVSIND